MQGFGFVYHVVLQGSRPRQPVATRPRQPVATRPRQPTEAGQPACGGEIVAWWGTELGSRRQQAIVDRASWASWGILYCALSGEFVDDFIYLASKPQLTIEEFLRKDADHEIDNLRVAYLEFLDKCAETACGVIDQQENEDVIPGDEDSEARAELTKRAKQLRRQSALFHSLGSWMNQDTVWKGGGKMSTIWEGSRVGKFVGTAGKQNSLMLLSADLFPTEAQFGKSDAAKHLQVTEKDLSKALDWMVKAKGPSTIVVALDGRERKLRRVLEDWAENFNKDPQRLLQGSLPMQPVALPP